MRRLTSPGGLAGRGADLGARSSATGFTFAKSLSVFIGGGRNSGSITSTVNGSVGVNLSNSTVDSRSLGLQGVQAQGQMVVGAVADLVHHLLPFGQGAFGVLGRGPDLAALDLAGQAGAHLGGGVHWLHGGVMLVRVGVFGLKGIDRRGQRRHGF